MSFVSNRKSEGAVLGVLGGMGPAATADFYVKLVKATPATRDQDHIPVVVVGDPRIADRSHAIETGTEVNVLSGLRKGLNYLERIGVDAVAMPCNTAHWWLPSLKAETNIPFISLIEASVRQARRSHPRGSTALVLGTRATMKWCLYGEELRKADFIPVTLPDSQQEIVNSIIAYVKRGHIRRAASIFRRSSQNWSYQADVVLLACTELPLAVPTGLKTSPQFIDTTAALVDACIDWAKSVSGEGPDQKPNSECSKSNQNAI